MKKFAKFFILIWVFMLMAGDNVNGNHLATTFANDEDLFGEVDEMVKVVRVNRFPSCDIPTCKDKFKYQGHCLGELDSRKCPSPYNPVRRT